MTIDPNKIPIYIRLGTEIVFAGVHAIERVADLFGATELDVAIWRRKLAEDEPKLDALVRHLRARISEEGDP